MSDVLGVLREKLDEKGLDAILVSGPESRRYVSGFTGSAGYLLVSRVGATLATDFRYVEQAGNQSPAFQVTKMGTGWSWLLDLLKETPLREGGLREPSDDGGHLRSDHRGPEGPSHQCEAVHDGHPGYYRGDADREAG